MLWGGGSPPASRPATTLTPSQYADRVGRAAQDLERIPRASKPTSRAIDGALDQVPSRATVRSSSSAPAMSVDNGALLAELRDTAGSGRAGREKAARELRSLQAGIASHEPPPPDARKALAHVLAGREFRVSWLQRMREKLGEMWGRLLAYVLEHLPRAPSMGNWHVPANLWRMIGYSTLIAAGLVVVLLVVRMVLRLAAPPRASEALLALGEEAPARPHGEWLAEAERMLREGHHAAAVRALYLAALMRLDETGHLSYDRTRADGRFVRALELKGEGELARELRGLGGLFSRIWYGLAPAGAEEYERARQVWSRLEAMTAS